MHIKILYFIYDTKGDARNQENVPASPVLRPDLWDAGPVREPVVAVEPVAGVDLLIIIQNMHA